MDVLVVTLFDIPHVGGLSTHVQLLLDGLRRRGDSVRLIEGGRSRVGKWRKALHYAAAGFDRDRYRVRVLRNRLRLVADAVAAEVRRRRPDVIHSHDALASAAVATAQLTHPMPPLIQTVHGPAL